MKIATILVLSASFVALIGTVIAQNRPPATNRVLERVGDTGFLALQADSFPQLDTQQKALAYWLTQASIAIDPIIYDQLSRFGIREKRLLEEVVARPASADPETFKKIRDYALLFWAKPGQSQRKHRTEIPAGVHLRATSECRVESADGWSVQDSIWRPSGACDAGRRAT